MDHFGRRHPTVRRVRGLRRDRAARDAEGVFVAEGIHLAEEALAAGAEVVLALVSPALERRREGARLIAALEARGVEVAATDDAVLDGLQDARSAQPVLVVVRRAAAAPPDPAAGPAVVACGLQDPGNLGAIVRTAAAAGASAVVACGDGVDPFHPRAVRATAGAIFRLPPATAADARAALEGLAGAGFALVGACASADVPYDRHDWSRPTALVLGSEGAGLPDAVRARLDLEVAIPMAREVESLSVGAAAAVLLFEAARARRATGGVSGE